MVTRKPHNRIEATSPAPDYPPERVDVGPELVDEETAWPPTTIHSIADAILHAIVYADLFDFPLTSQEIHRYLPRYSAPLRVIEEHIASHDQFCGRPGSTPPYWFLAGRDHLVALRQEREALSRALWPLAWRYGHLMAAMPFVRMVAITGSLTMNNVTSAQDDVDFLIVTRTGWVWFSRGLIVLVVHLAQQMGVELCPNYVLAEHRLQLGEPSLFTAHELAQLVPLYGLQPYRLLLQRNDWMAGYQPNASPHQAGVRELGAVARHGQRLLEGALGGRAGDTLERWECERKILRLRRTATQGGGTGALYTPDLCKGHVDDHAADVRRRYAARLAAQGM